MSSYTLQVTEAEIARYRAMAQMALESESLQLELAGVLPGAHVADVGCGPGAMTFQLANLVGATGRVTAVERDEIALGVARESIAASGVSHVEFLAGEASATGVTPESVDVAMMRHVLAHNGGHEQEIVDHLATLVRPGGSVYLVDVDLTAMRAIDMDPELADLTPTYAEFHRNRGNDPSVGLRLGSLLEVAGLEVACFRGSFQILQPPAGMRPPSWAAREAMIAEGAATPADVERWGAALVRMDEAEVRPTMFFPTFLAIGRRP